MTARHRHLAEQELLDLSLEGRGPRAAGRLACPQCAESLAELELFLGRCRAAAESVEAPADSSGHLAERVLARTTREDLGWRGDLRLLRGFVGQRLRSSGVLRFAAASLLVHLLALPVLAWFAFRAAPREYAIQVDFDYPREQTLPDVPAEPERQPEMPGPEPEPQLVERELPPQAGRAAAARRAERSFLTSIEVPAVAAEPPDEPLARLLWARSTRLSKGRLPDFLERGTPPAAAGPLEQALWAEVLMDHLVLAGERLPGLDASLARLAEGAPVPEAERVLSALALRRAGSFGLLDARRTGRVQTVLADLGLPEEGGVEAAETWARALSAALEGTRAADSEAARSWSRWGR